MSSKTATSLVFTLTFLVIVIIIMLQSNYTTRNHGGNVTINIEENRKLVNVTWKNSSLWILTREMNENDIAESYKFVEDSNFGIFEGTVNIIESKIIK